METMRALATALVLAGALGFAPDAGAHGEAGRATGFTSAIERVTPPVDGLELRVLDSDDRLYLENRTGAEVIVLGYDEEPYLRFAEGAVYRNVRSPAVYLNADRYALGAVPESANPDAAPVWRRVRAGSHHEWHDHRIQWMSTIPPDAVRADPDRAQHVFDWHVPITVDGRAVTIAGSLDYAPVDEGPTAWVWVAATLPLAAALLAWAVLRGRLRPEAVAS
jgi:hypothetical protein